MSHLTASLRYVRDHAVEFGGDGVRTVLAGRSAGAGAATGFALLPALAEGVRLVAAVGIAGRYDLPARSTGTAPLDDVTAARTDAVPITLVHGAADAVLNAGHSLGLRRRAARRVAGDLTGARFGSRRGHHDGVRPGARTLCPH